jgi:energy-coupling factor transporter ATP-binding protein EcfA2
MDAQPHSKLTAHYAATRSKDEHVTIEWDNIEYAVITKDSKNSTFMKTASKNNRILRNLSGRAESGQLIAIMGPTGCGKTSLLNVLAARMPNSSSSSTKLTGNDDKDDGYDSDNNGDDCDVYCNDGDSENDKNDMNDGDDNDDNDDNDDDNDDDDYNDGNDSK